MPPKSPKPLPPRALKVETTTTENQNRSLPPKANEKTNGPGAALAQTLIQHNLNNSNVKS